jgi:outer membrane protein OmpA-like peptidoglycan-associated protein
VGKKLPRELLEAENALQIAKVAGADQYAPDSYQKADAALQQAEKYQVQKPGQKPVITMAREAAVRAEDARVIAVRRQIAEHQEQERQAAAAREKAARDRAEAESQQRAKAEAEARDEAARRAQAEADRQAAEQAKAAAQAAAEEADRQRAAALQAKADADAARQQLAVEAEKARQSAAEADRLRQKAEQDQAQLRQQLLDEFNQVLQTRDTARGLIINMSDVLFASGRWDLKPVTREKLARLSGIILSHPGLRLQVEGYTDDVGSDAFNQRLSERRADSVRDFLLSQGIADGNVSAQGFGKTNFVADNNTAAGRQQNRRVELVVSGEIIGTNINAIRTQTAAPAQP